MGMLSGRVWRDDGLAAAFGEPVAELGRVIGAIGDQPLRGGDVLEQGGGPDQIVGLAGGHGKGDGPADVVGYGMNLGRPSAARSADGVLEGPPFAPAAERCALTWVESIAVVLTTPLEPLRA